MRQRPWETADGSPPRVRWTTLLARLTSGFVRAIPEGGSPAWPRLPGADPGRRTTGMEAFARMSVAWGAWLGGPGNPSTIEHDGRRVDVLDLVVRGLVDATDPEGPWYWGHIRDRDQRIVEAAEIAFALWAGREWLVPALGEARLGQVLDWLAEVHGRDVYADNWVLFPSIVATVSRGLGRSIEDALIDEGIDRMLRWDRGDGWYSDGEGHAFDRYTGWAIHWHLLHWAEVDGDRRPAVRDRVRRAAGTWLADVPAFAAADGAFPLFGRSLGYRFATASPLALAATLDLLPIDPGLARGIIDRSIGYHLAHDAIDPATDWFRVGVWGQRPDVCERYMSAGASAWAARSLVALALDAAHPFWTAPDPGLPAAPPGSTHAVPDLVLRGPGFLVGRETATGATWLASALLDHPDDIPGHDYRPFYGKWLYHSEHPLTERTADRSPGPDGALVLEAADGSTGHRALVEAGGVGPGWAWSRFRVGVSGRDHGVTVVSVRHGDAWVRAIGLRPRGPVRAVAASLPLATTGAASIAHTGDDGAGTQAATDGRRWVAIRRLAGFDASLPSGPAAAGEDRNLVAEHAEQPRVAESVPSSARRLLALADAARGAGRDPSTDLAAIEARVVGRDALEIRLPDGEAWHVAAGARAPKDVELAGWRFRGPGVRVACVGRGGERLAGESLAEIVGVVRLERPGPVEVRRLEGGGVLVGTTEGLTLDGGWLQGRPGRLEVLHAGAWAGQDPPPVPGLVPQGMVRRAQRRTGHRFVWLRLLP